MMRIVTFGNTKVWLFIQQLHYYKGDDTKSIVELPEFLCYFKFTEPTVIILGELIHDPISRQPVIFASPEEAEKYATDFLLNKFDLVS